MLERFHVPSEIAIRVQPDVMRQTVEDIFRGLGMPDEHAKQSTDVLLYADVRGIESHGVSNMLRVYVQSIRDGRINLNPKWRITHDAPAICTIDSDGAHGGVIGPEAMRIAIDRARQFGIGAVAVANGGHFGAAAYHAAMALEHDMIGVAMTAGGVGVLPTGGAERLIGLNPIAVAIPTQREPPFIFDASMSSVAGNKVRLLQRLGAPTAPGWIADADGTPIMEEREIPEGFMILPLGGTREIGSHKGYGLGVIVEVLTTVLAGTGAGPDRRAGQAHHFIAYDVKQFTDLDVFKDDTDTYMRRLRESKPAPGEERVWYAGLPEHEEEAERRERGIPYHPEVIGWFKATLAELGLPDRLPS
ncbi:MAG: Ldh family oxidoreductase [Chloroflexi bacterium]|nr:Ldh family oxidoreductase [Chloroflexota bacterium]MDA1002442.1 Ldh family oxidoreductase [Chloroflexota bacterium]